MSEVSRAAHTLVIYPRVLWRVAKSDRRAVSCDMPCKQQAGCYGLTCDCRAQAFLESRQECKEGHSGSRGMHVELAFGSQRQLKQKLT
jgi:hypothetical protein